MWHLVFVVGAILGGVAGYWLLNSLYGAAFGLLLGAIAGWTARRAPVIQESEEKLASEKSEKIRQSFFNSMFSIMGHVCKSSGTVQPEQIKAAEGIMKRMGLNSVLRSSAINLFTEGKHPDFDLDRTAKHFRDECSQADGLYRVFLEVQTQVALADGFMAPEEEEMLVHVARVLGHTEAHYRQIELLVRINLGLGDNHNKRYVQRRSNSSAKGLVQSKGKAKSTTSSSTSAAALTAYQILGVDQEAGKGAVKRAYRKLMSQHHPDKLIAKGLPQEMVRLATDNTQEIQKAYEQIKRAKSWA